MRSPCQCRSLEYLRVGFSSWSPGFSDELHAGIIRQTTAKSVGLGGGDIGIKTIRAARESTSLESLSFYSDRITNTELQLLRDSPSLKRIAVGCKLLPPSALEIIAELPTLESLSLNAKLAPSDSRMFEHLPESDKLKSLDLEIWYPLDSDVIELRKLENLTSLSIGCENLTDSGCRILAEHPTLSWVVFQGSREKSDLCRKWWEARRQ